MIEDVETRMAAGRPGPIEFRADPSGARRIGGLASVFNSYSRNLGGFVERILPTAFNRSRGNGWPDVTCRYNHRDLLGTTGSGTLVLTVVSAGLDYDVLPPRCRADVVELVERGDVRKSSFSFTTPAGGDEWRLTESGFPLRDVHTVDLADVAPVDSPAYVDTSAALRSLALRADAEVADVHRYAGTGELHRLLTRTDGAGPRRHAAPTYVDLSSARAALEVRRYDPYAPVASPRLSGSQALDKLLTRRTDVQELAA